MRGQSFVVAIFLLSLLMVETGGLSAADRDQVPAGQLISLNEPALTESSGLAASRLHEGRFWSHNDSGGKPRLFAFDDSGRSTGQCQLKLAGAVDWEDIASFDEHGTARLVVADCGDNQFKRESVSLYLLDEPDPNASTDVETYQTLVVKYSDGPNNCEAIAVDPVRKQIVMVTKSALPAAGIYVIPLPDRGESGTTKVTARRVGTLPLPMVSAMDIHPLSGDVWVVNYFQAFQFPCTDRRGPIDRQLAELPRSVDLPRWKQIEAVAVDDADQVWVTSEGSPTPMTRLSLQQSTSR